MSITSAIVSAPFRSTISSHFTEGSTERLPPRTHLNFIFIEDSSLCLSIKLSVTRFAMHIAHSLTNTYWAIGKRDGWSASLGRIWCDVDDKIIIKSSLWIHWCLCQCAVLHRWQWQSRNTLARALCHPSLKFCRWKKNAEKQKRENGKWQLYGDVCCVRACSSVILPLSSHIDISPRAARYRFSVSVRSRAPLKMWSNRFIISIQFYFSLSRTSYLDAFDDKWRWPI